MRSQKVQKMIDNIPHSFIRLGNLTLFSIMVSVFLLAYFIKTPYKITTTIKFEQINNCFVGSVLISEKDILKVKKGQKVLVYVENINKVVFNSSLCEVSDKPIIKGNTISYRGQICNIESFSIIEETKGVAKITIDEINFLERVVLVLRSI